MTEFFWAQYSTIATWLDSHGKLAWIVLLVWGVLWVISKVASGFSAVDILKARVLGPFVTRLRFKRLVKATKKFDIRGHVNTAVGELQSELPTGWIRQIDIEWVQKESKADFFSDNEIVVRVRPFNDQARNFVNVTYQFLKKSFFPRVRKVIPENQREAAIIYVCGRIAARRDQAAFKAFTDYVFEPAVDKKGKVVTYYDRFKNLDDVGLFTGPLLREVQHIAERVQTTSLRNRMSDELNESLKHMEDIRPPGKGTARR